MISCRWFSRADAVFVAALVIVAGICTYIGIALPLGSFADDAFFLLGNAYRVAGGQIPHVDFSSPWGPVIFLIEATGLHLSGMRPNGLGYSNALFGSLIAIWAFFVARARWSPAVGCVAGVYTLLLIVAPFVLGGYPRDFSYAMIYNRYGYALLGIVLLECAGDMLSAKDRVRPPVGFAVSTGVALGLLLFLKISYALVAMAFVVALPLAGSAGGWRRLAAMFGGFALVAVAALSYLRFDLRDMLQDLTMAASSRAPALKPLTLTGIVCLENAALVILAAIMRTYRAAFVAWLTIGIGGVVLVTNQQLGGFPLDAYAALALAGAYVPYSEYRQKWPAGIALATVLCVLPLGEASVISLTSAALHWPPQPGATLAMPERDAVLTFAPFVGKVKTETDGVEYVEDLNDGLNLLRRHLDKREGVLTFDQFNPFDYILDLPAPRGGFAAAAYDYIFDNAYHPSAERFFGNAVYVLVPKYKKRALDRYEEDGDTLALLRIYGSALRARFAVVGETKHWVLWRRKTNE
ncbi:MAG TPA: hypothetical protein VFE36_03975 [Candidatus Baltobacteraceae bacterium]|nr:hypothetical protein [Candidatus Baltobacteraceae bacterium]